MTFKPLLFLALSLGASAALGQGDNSRILHGNVQFNDSTTQTTAATAPAIGGAITGGTTCSVLFIGAGPVLAQDNTAFCWDATNHRLGVGTTTPANPLSVVGIIQSTTGGFKFPDGTTQTTAATAPAIGGAVTGGTTCSVLFIGAGPVLAQDNSAFCWDVTNHRLGIGTTTPAAALDVNGTADLRGLTLFGDTIGALAGTWDINPSSGTYTTAVFGAFKWVGNTGFYRDDSNAVSQRNDANAQALYSYNTFTDTSNYERGGFDWQTTSNVLRIGAQALGTGTLRNTALMGGSVGVQTTAPASALDVNGAARIGEAPATVTTLDGAITNSDATITVHDTTGYPAVGFILIEAEVIAYSGKTGTTFTGCTRGAYGSTAVSHIDALPASSYLALFSGSATTLQASVLGSGAVGFGPATPLVPGLTATYFPMTFDPSTSNGVYLNVNADATHAGMEINLPAGADQAGFLLFTTEPTATSPAMLVSHAGASPAMNITASSNGVATETAIAATGSLTVGGGVDALSAGFARGVSITTNEIAGANNDVLTGLYVNSTFNDNSFTGVKEAAAVFLGGNVGIGIAAPGAPLDMGDNPTAIRLGGLGKLYGVNNAQDYFDPFQGQWATPGGGHQFIDSTGGASWTGPVAAGAAGTVLTNDGAGNTSWVAPGGGGGTPTIYTNTVNTSATCTATCGAGHVTGGGCSNSSPNSLFDSHPASTTVWSCTWPNAITNCTAYVICI